MTVRVASVPAGHPYVQRLGVPGARVLADPPVPGAPAGQWWPSPILTAAWIDSHASDVDLVHVHFGTESMTPRAVDDWLAALDRSSLPLVFTVHDIDHPHLAEQAPYREQLDRLLPAAASVITLTHGAADVLARRHGVRAGVIPHPQLAPDAWFAEADARRPSAGQGARPRVAIHLRSGRANIATGPWLECAVRAIHAAGAHPVLYVNAGPAAADLAGRARRIASDLAACTTHVRPRPDDDGLATELAAADLAFLPYAHGTHSGWVELCWDLGVPVMAPPVGHLAEQHRDPWFLATVDPTDAEAVRRAIAALSAQPPPPAAVRLAGRRARRADIATRHAAIYRVVTAATVAVTRGPTGGAAARREVAA